MTPRLRALALIGIAPVLAGCAPPGPTEVLVPPPNIGVAPPVVFYEAIPTSPPGCYAYVDRHGRMVPLTCTPRADG